MNISQKVAANSMWLIVQPLVLNVISIVVTGYIARVLGQTVYGQFVFVLTFVGIFLPMATPGLRAITVREIARDKAGSKSFIGKMIGLRFFLSISAIVAIAVIFNLMHYPSGIKSIVYVYALSIVFNTLSLTFVDVFQAHEEMKYVAYTQFISGIVLTALSVLVLIVGSRLAGLIYVYTFGSVLSFIISTFCMFKLSIPITVKVDLQFWKENIVRGLPFFIPNMIGVIGAKIGIILLSQMSGDAAVGQYGAATNIIEKLLVIPDGICTAIYPTMTILYHKSRGETALLYRQYIFYLTMLGLPIAVGTTLLARPIVLFVYGTAYLAVVPILRILIWVLFITFLTSLQSWTLGAINREKIGAIIPFVGMPIVLGLSFLLIPRYQAIGAAVSRLITAVVCLCLLQTFVRRHLLMRTHDSRVKYVKVIGANVVMAGIVYLMRDLPVIISVCGGVAVYLAAIVGLGVLEANERNRVWCYVVDRISGRKSGA